jgi:hypothetical protein
MVNIWFNRALKAVQYFLHISDRDTYLWTERPFNKHQREAVITILSKYTYIRVLNLLEIRLQKKKPPWNSCILSCNTQLERNNSLQQNFTFLNLDSVPSSDVERVYAIVWIKTQLFFYLLFFIFSFSNVYTDTSRITNISVSKGFWL